MRFGLLLRINAVAGPDEEPQHQRKQQAHQSLNGSDRAFCVGDMLARKRMLQQDAEHAAGENDAHDQHRPPDKCHRQPHSASIAPNGRAPGVRVAYARSPRQLAHGLSALEWLPCGKGASSVGIGLDVRLMRTGNGGKFPFGRVIGFFWPASRGEDL